MRRLWLADLVLAILLPTFLLPAVAAAVSSLAEPDPYEDQHFIWIDPLWDAPLVASFLVAAAWSYLRPSQALRAQLVPAATLLVAAVVVASLFATTRSAP